MWIKQFFRGLGLVLALVSLVGCEDLIQELDNSQSTSRPISPRPSAGNEHVKRINADTLSPRQVKPGAEQILYKGRAVKLSKHAKERMDCRTIEAFEVQEVFDKGQINRAKTRTDDKPCPSTAYEYRTLRDKQRIRAVVAYCEGQQPVLVTVIDLDNKYDCE